MAISRPGILGTVSGTIGGVEVQQNGGRGIIKRCKVIYRGRTPGKIRSQTLQRDVITHWRALTDAQRRAWDSAAKQRTHTDRFGQAVMRSGYQLFASMPHDFRYTTTKYWYTNPPTLINNPEGNPTVTATAGTTLMAIFPAYTPSPFTYCGTYIARMCQNTTRKPKRWQAVGLADISDATFLLLTELESSGIPLLQNEIIAVRFSLSGASLWPWYSQTIFTTVA